MRVSFADTLISMSKLPRTCVFSRVKCHHAVFIIVVEFSLSRAISMRFDSRTWLVVVIGMFSDPRECMCVCVCVAFANEEFSVWRSSSPLLFLSLFFSRFSFVPFPIGIVQTHHVTRTRVLFYRVILTASASFPSPFSHTFTVSRRLLRS